MVLSSLAARIALTFVLLTQVVPPCALEGRALEHVHGVEAAEVFANLDEPCDTFELASATRNGNASDRDVSRVAVRADGAILLTSVAAIMAVQASAAAPPEAERLRAHTILQV